MVGAAAAGTDGGMPLPADEAHMDADASHAPTAAREGGAGDAAPDGGGFVSVPRAAWSNLLTLAQAQLHGDPTPWREDDDVYGSRQREAVTIVHHGPRGGVYQLWATSEAEARALVRMVRRLQAQLAAEDADAAHDNAS